MPSLFAGQCGEISDGCDLSARVSVWVKMVEKSTNVCYPYGELRIVFRYGLSEGN